jgi:8-amino-7-oxononanoate synthase
MRVDGAVTGATPEEGSRTTTGPSWTATVADALRLVAESGRWRSPRVFAARGPRGVLVDLDREVVAFASNDYLGLSEHPVVRVAAHEALDRWGAGAGASRLVTGSRPVHAELEAALADWKDAEAAVVLPTGFAANLAVLATMGRYATAIFSDELNHASIVDGCRLARAPVTVYRHVDVEHLDSLLASRTRPALVVSDAVFSMDGDMAPVTELCECCRRHGAVLVLDEAHGVVGPEISARDRRGVELLRVGTLSKTLGSLGGFVAGTRQAVDLLVNEARPYIFTTAASPADAAAALAALGVLRSEEGASLVRRLRAHMARLSVSARTPIVPVVLGDEDTALRASAALLERGIWVPAIRPPTVAPGTSRLRVTLSAAHRTDEVQGLVEALAEVVEGWRAPRVARQPVGSELRG